jgi:hypothetical protein
VVLDEIVGTVISHVSPTDETTTKYQMKSKEQITPVPRFTVVLLDTVVDKSLHFALDWCQKIKQIVLQIHSIRRS